MEIAIRESKDEDLEQGAELIIRMKRLNGEFDPLFKVVDDIKSKTVKYLADSRTSKSAILLVVVQGKKVVGILRAVIIDRFFYEPTVEGQITDFYILPEARRKALGNEMLQDASKRLKHMGAEMVTAEFPAQNEIAARFYNRKGFRALLNVFAKEEG